MSRALSPMLIARSTVSIAAPSTTELDVIDFDLGVDQAVEIMAVKSIHTLQVQGITTSITQAYVYASLHLEDAAVDDPQLDEDATDRDTEVIHADSAQHGVGDDSGSAAGGLTHSVNLLATPIEHFPERILSAINITHRLETNLAMDAATHVYLIYYRYVRLSDQELIAAFAKRR